MSAFASSGGDQPFEYVTLTGSVIRSVVPPGKGANSGYRVNQGYARPYGSAAPPAAAPKSPISYPPQPQQWNVPSQKPAGNPYATLPRTPVGPQDACESLQPQYGVAEECYAEPLPAGAEFFEVDRELEEANRQTRLHFAWPPLQDDEHVTPTAAPLYIAPPETQHVVAKPVQQVPPEPQASSQQQAPTQTKPQWQSRSAPQLGQDSGLQAPEIESSSESYTSTSTTTTTTSEEYQRMYAAQVQAYQMQQAFEQSGSELDYTADMEVAAMQQHQLEISSCMSSGDYLSGRRSAQECVDSLAAPLNTYKLIDMVREVTPSPVHQPIVSRRVVFNDEPEVKQLQDSPAIPESPITAAASAEVAATTTTETAPQISEKDQQELIIDDRSNILASERIFQPTPEIKIEIAPVRQIPPTKIPNPVPKEWINPMVRVLTTAPEVPFHLSDCPCPKPCDCKCEVDPELSNQVQDIKPADSEHLRRSASPEPEERPTVLSESPRRGSLLSSAMSVAPEYSIQFAPPPSKMVPLPEETVPYMPPPMDLKPYMREDYRPKSPFVSALTTAPEKPFEGHFDRDVPIHIIDLPTPKEHLTMSDALRTAPDRAYTPLNPENATHMFESEQEAKEKKKYEFQVLDREKELGIKTINCELPDSVEYYTTEKRRREQQHQTSSAFAAMQAFQPSREPLEPTTTPRRSVVSLTQGENDLEYEKYFKAQERNTKRLNYYHKMEEEFQHSQQQQQQQHQVQEIYKQEQNTQNYTTSAQQASSLSSYTKASSSSNSSSTVQQQTSNNYNYNNNNNNNNNITTTSAISTTTTTSANSNLYSSNQASRSMLSATYPADIAPGTSHISAKFENREIIEETAEELEHSEVLFPPPSPLSHLRGRTVQSGLHKPESIPKYQRNWTVLPTQSPARTPEPQELRDNVPLAFVDTPKTPHTVVSTASNTIHRPVAQMSNGTPSTPSTQQQTTAAAVRGSITSAGIPSASGSDSGAVSFSNSQQQPTIQPRQQLPSTNTQPTKPTAIPIIIEDRSGPVTMAFQSLDDHLQSDQSQTPSRPYTPSAINKPAPIVPFYQTPEKLCFDECPATHARAYDRRSASPFPDRTRSPAPGPPPNPLAAIRAPRMKDPEPAITGITPRVLQAGSITTGQSYLGAQHAQQQQLQQQQGQILSHSETKTKSGMQSYTQQPEIVQQQTLGDLTIEKRQRESHLEEQKQSQMQSQTTTQVGNTQIERRRKVTEEYEHTQSAKTVEIRTGSAQTTSTPISSTERRQSYGKTGYVANQARRLSNLEQEITNLTSQSQAISARAANLGSNIFPHSPEPDAKFPIKPVLPPHDEPSPASYVLSASANSKMVGAPPGFQSQRLSGAGASSLVSTQQQLQQQQQQQKSILSEHSSATTTSTTSNNNNNFNNYNYNNNNYSYNNTSSSSMQANAVSCNLITKASATTTTTTTTTNTTTTTTNNQAYAANTGICPVTGTYCRPGHTCCKQQQQQQQQLLLTPNASNRNASAGLTGNISKPSLPSLPSLSSGIGANAAAAPAAPVASVAAASTNIAATAASATQQATAAAAAAAAKATATTTSSAPLVSDNTNVGGSTGAGGKGGAFGVTSAPKRGRGIMNKAVISGVRVPLCNSCGGQIRGPFITALGRIWCPEHFMCVRAQCRRPLQDIGFVEEKGDLYCEYCFEQFLAPSCSKCGGKIKGDCLNAIGRHFHPECFTCAHCGKLFGNTPFFLEDGNAYCEADWNELFTTKCFACGFPVEAGDRWVEALNHNYHSQCFNCTYCKQNLEGQSFYNKGGRPFCKNHAR